MICPLAKSSSFRRKLGIGDEVFVALYAGNMGEKQGLDILIEAARRLDGYTGTLFVLAGEGAARSRLRCEADELSNIVWLPLQPIELLNDLLNLADAHLLPQLAGAADLVMPSKLTGMLSSGRPVIATAAPNTQVARVVSTCGLVVPPGDVTGVINALMELEADKIERWRLGKQARKYACERLAKEPILREFSDRLTAARQGGKLYNLRHRQK